MRARSRRWAVAAATAGLVAPFAGCGSRHAGGAATTTTVPHPAAGLAAPAGAAGAASLAADVGCGRFDPFALHGLPVSLGAASAGTCPFGSTTLLIVTFSTSGAVAGALRLAGGLGVLAGSTVYVAEGPNWLATGTTSPSQSVADRVVARIGGQVKKVTSQSGPGSGEP